MRLRMEIISGWSTMVWHSSLVLASIFVGIKYNSRHNKSQVPMKCNWFDTGGTNR
jgi:hypothetical protein